MLASLSTGFAGTTAASLSDQWYLGVGYVNSQLLPRAEATDVTRSEEIGQGATVLFGRDFDERSSGQIQLYSLGDVVFSDDSTATYTAADASLLYRFYDSRDRHRNSRFGLSVYGRFGFGVTERESTIPLRNEGASPVYFGAGGGLETYLNDTFAVRSELLFHEKETISASLSLVTRFGGRKGRAGGLQELPVSSPPANSTVTNEPVRNGTLTQTTALPAAKPQALPIPTQDAGLPEVAIMVDPDQLPDVALMIDPRTLTEPELDQNKLQTTTPQTSATQISRDGDKDGIPDQLDQCGQSTLNYPVSANGCSLFVQAGSQIQFVEDSPLPLPLTERVLEQLAASLNQFPNTRIELIAHTDNAGDPLAKSALTRQRLRTVGIYLVQRGISQDRLLLRSFGDKRPAFDNSSAEGRQANNRIEIVERP